MRVRIYSVILGLVSAVPQHGSAASTGWTHFGLRPLGMGNVFVAIADDENALFYNPAGLADVTFDGELLNPSFYVSKNAMSFAKDAEKIGETSEVSELLDLLAAHAGKTQAAGMRWSPHMVGRGWGIGVSLGLPLAVVAHESGSLELLAGAELIAPVGLATAVFSKRLRLGAALKAVRFIGIDSELSIDQIEELRSSDRGDELLLSGKGIGVDLGMLYTADNPMQPTLGIVVTDVGGTPYELSPSGSASSPGKPTPRPATFGVGFSWVPWKSKRLQLRTAAEVHEANLPFHYSKKFNLGAELSLGQTVRAQLGLRHGLVSAGLGFDVGVLNLKLVTYGVDHGLIVGQDPRLVDRRYAAQIKWLI